MASLEAFDKDVKELVNSNKLSSSRIKAVTDAAMANIASDTHIVATLFKVHKQAKSTHKISSLYVIDAIAREARQQAKKAAKGKRSSSNSTTPQQDGAGSGVNDDSDDFASSKRKSGAKGTYASFLSKIESFLDRLVTEVLTKGPPEHKDKVKKVLDIWKKSATFSSEALKPCYAKLSGEVFEADAKAKKPDMKHADSTSDGFNHRSTTPPYPPPEKPFPFPQYQTASGRPSISSSQPPSQVPTPLPSNTNGQSTDLAALLGSITASSLVVPSAPPLQSTQQVTPTFQSTQLALLQQLAAQAGTSTSFSAVTNPTPILPNTSSHAVDERPLHSSSDASARARSPPVPTRRQSRWDKEGNSHSERDGGRRRSLSPHRERHTQHRRGSPARRPGSPVQDRRRSNWPSDAEDSRLPRSNRRPQQDTRQIATFISDDRREDRPGTKGKDNRYAFESDDFSTFEVQTDRNPHQVSQDASSFSNQQWQQKDDATRNPDFMANAAPFNPASFNALEPESWASFAIMCQGNMGRLPSNMEMMQWIMSSMAMMQASVAQMNGGDGSQAPYGMLQGMDDSGMSATQQHVEQTEGLNNQTQPDENDRGGRYRPWGHRPEASGQGQDRESSIEPDRRPPPPSRDDEGEADMQMTPEAD